MNMYPVSPSPRLNGTSFQKKYGIVKNAFEANYLQVRRTTTRARHVFTLDYSAITETEFSIIDDFFDANIGTIFNFTHPQTLVIYQVTFQNDTLDKTPVTDTHCSTKIVLESI